MPKPTTQYIKKMQEKPNRVDIPAPGWQRGVKHFTMRIVPEKDPSRLSDPGFQIRAATKIFDQLVQWCPAGIFKHLTILFYEHDQQTNNYLGEYK